MSPLSPPISTAAGAVLVAGVASACAYQAETLPPGLAGVTLVYALLFAPSGVHTHPRLSTSPRPPLGLRGLPGTKSRPKVGQGA